MPAQAESEAPAAPAADKAALERWRPADRRFVQDPVALPFGAHAHGWLVNLSGLRSADPSVLCYVAPEPQASDAWVVIPLRDADSPAGAFDTELRTAFAIGPDGAKDIVLLERYSRNAAAGGERQHGGRVFRLTSGHARQQRDLSARLDGITDAASARGRLEADYARLLPPIAGSVAQAFAEVPAGYVDLTRLERHQRLQQGHPLLEALDTRHGYLALRGEGGHPGYHAALFRHADGGWLLAVQKRLPDNQETWFLRKEQGRWRNVSAAVLPGWRVAADYHLPRNGRVVEGENGMAWAWNGRSFTSVAPDSPKSRAQQINSERPADSGDRTSWRNGTLSIALRQSCTSDPTG